jgi:hypothetical protein
MGEGMVVAINLHRGFRPKYAWSFNTWFLGRPEIVDFWGPHGPDRPQRPFKKLEGKALHIFGGVWRPMGPVQTLNIQVFSAPAYTPVADAQSLG